MYVEWIDTWIEEIRLHDRRARVRVLVLLDAHISWRDDARAMRPT